MIPLPDAASLLELAQRRKGDLAEWAAAPPPSTLPPAPADLRQLCQDLIDALPANERPLLQKTLGNLRHEGDLKGFSAYLEAKVQPKAA